ncbi:hypothetical protein RHSIM_Rhsim11G0052600 [Rhododendron simsii]|uniref:Uncharacterized protein n=1 Tax=Rhododendron simsii TaxID=118357 RepID=A0A834LAA0_RHOSS|nr:hypothetical protein RHSIM_Rhsim11G0052600 [Rhododendron simsii]
MATKEGGSWDTRTATSACGNGAWRWSQRRGVKRSGGRWTSSGWIWFRLGFTLVVGKEDGWLKNNGVPLKIKTMAESGVVDSGGSAKGKEKMKRPDGEKGKETSAFRTSGMKKNFEASGMKRSTEEKEKEEGGKEEEKERGGREEERKEADGEREAEGKGKKHTNQRMRSEKALLQKQ